MQTYFTAVLNPEEGEEAAKLLSYILKHGFGSPAIYYVGYIICETLNAANVCFQIMATNYFLGKDFLDYGPTFFPAPEDMFARTDQLSLLFCSN